MAERSGSEVECWRVSSSNGEPVRLTREEEGGSGSRLAKSEGEDLDMRRLEDSRPMRYLSRDLSMSVRSSMAR